MWLLVVWGRVYINCWCELRILRMTRPYRLRIWLKRIFLYQILYYAGVSASVKIGGHSSEMGNSQPGKSSGNIKIS